MGSAAPGPPCSAAGSVPGEETRVSDEKPARRRPGKRVKAEADQAAHGRPPMVDLDPWSLLDRLLVPADEEAPVAPKPPKSK